jgi:hypothetical protein
MRWDYFISHASEDKRLVAAPLAHYLKSVGFSVWYDDFSLEVGDSILAGINGGLAASEYGIVILSPSFFGKNEGGAARRPASPREALLVADPGRDRIV